MLTPAALVPKIRRLFDLSAAVEAVDVDGPHLRELVGDIACPGGSHDRQLGPEGLELPRQQPVDGSLLTLT